MSRRYDHTAQPNIKHREKVITHLNCSQHYPHLRDERLRTFSLLGNLYDCHEDTPLIRECRILRNHGQHRTESRIQQDGASPHQIEIRTPQNEEFEPSKNGIITYALCTRLYRMQNRMLLQPFHSYKSKMYSVTMFPLIPVIHRTRCVRVIVFGIWQNHDLKTRDGVHCKCAKIRSLRLQSTTTTSITFGTEGSWLPTKIFST